MQPRDVIRRVIPSTGRRALRELAGPQRVATVTTIRAREAARRGDFARADELLRRLGGPEPAVERAANLFRLGRTDEANDLLAATPGLEALREEPVPENTDVYDDAFTRRLWSQYYDYMNQSPRENPDAWALHQTVDLVSALLVSRPEIREVINFGVMCAEPDHRLALRHPGVRFVGVDRQPLIAELNERAYQAPNLSFRAGDILDSIRESADARTLVLHVRTAVVCPVDLVRALYQEAAASGAQIALLEPGGLSHETLRFYEPGTFPAESITFRGIMRLHDYAALLEAAGYEPRVERRLATDLWFGSVPGDIGVWITAKPD